MSFTYFANGLRKTMADVSGTTTYGYDNRNRLTSKQTPFGTLSYTYDSAGNLLTPLVVRRNRSDRRPTTNDRCKMTASPS